MFTKGNLNKERLYYYLLDNLHIQVEKWGKGGSKPFDSLVSEIENGECTVDQAGVRRTKVVMADVISDKVRLIEVKQVFSDGRERKRQMSFGSLGEKMLPGENVFTTLNRMFEEEFKFHLFENFRHFRLDGPVYKINHRPSSSYPGLQNSAEEFRFVIHVDNQIRRILGQDQVVSVEQDKTTYFKWEALKV